MVGHRGFLPWGGNNSGVNGNSQSRGNYSPDGSIGQDNQYDHNYPPLQSNYSSPPRNGNRNYSPKNDNQDIPNRSHALPPVNSPPFHAESPRGGNHGFRGTGGNQRGTNSPQNDYEDVSRNSYLRDNNRRQQGDISLPRGNGNQQGYSPTRYPSMRREQSRSPSTQRVDDWNDYSPPPRGGAGHRRDVRSLQLDHWENNGTNNVRFPPNGNRRYSPERLYPENQNSISIDSRGESPSLAYHHHPQQRGDNYQRYENDNHSSRGDSSGASSSSGDQIDDPSVDILYEVGYRDGELIHIYPNYSDGTFGQVGSHHNILQTAPVANVTVESLMERFVRDHNTGVALLDPHLDLELEVNSSTIDTVIRSWKDADLECTLLENIMMMGCVTPRKVQQLAIPQIQSRLNVAIHSESGSGKTMAFAIPIVNHILKMSPEEREEAASMRSILALVVVPTRELSKQIGNVFSVLCQNTNIRVSISYGGLNSMGELSEGCDILVGTSQKMFFDIENLNLSHLEFFVIDEADLIFNDVIKNRQTGKYYPCIFDHKKLANNSKHQTIVSSSIRIPSSQYSESILDKSITFTHVRISRGQLSPRLNLIFNETNLRKYYGSKKQMLNETLYRRYGGQKTLVFFNSFQKCNEVYKTFSQKNWMAMFQSGDDQERRERILEEFRTGRISVLFTTDILSRGIDIIGVSIVIIYELPPFESKENFINRCGRVGRITSGDVHVFVGKPKEEKEIVGEIVQMVKDQGKADTIPVWVQNFGVQQQQDANPDSSKSSDSNSNATAFKPPAIVSDSSLSNQTKVPIVPTQTTNGPELIEDQSLLHQVAVVATPPPAHTETKRNVTKNPIAASNTSDFEKLSCIDKTPTESNQEDALNVSTSSQFVATPIAVAPNTTVSNQHSSSLEISGSEQLPRCDKTPTVTNPVGATANVLSQNLTAPNNSTITLDTPGLKQLSPVDKPNGKTVGAETNGVQPNGSFIEVLLVYFYSFFTFFSNFFTDQRADENVADHVENIGNHRAVSNNNGKSGTSRAAAGVNEVKAKKRMLKKLAREAKRGSRRSFVYNGNN